MQLEEKTWQNNSGQILIKQYVSEKLGDTETPIQRHYDETTLVTSFISLVLCCEIVISEYNKFYLILQSYIKTKTITMQTGIVK